LPDEANLIYKISLTENLTADIGTDPTFVRASSLTYADTVSSLDTVTTGNPAFGTYFGGTSAYGTGYVAFDTPRQNVITYSQQVEVGTGNWAAVGAPTVTQDQAAGPTGDTVMSLITANSNGDGVINNTIYAPNNVDPIELTFYAKTTTGTTNITVTAESTTVPQATETYTPTITTTLTKYRYMWNRPPVGNPDGTFDLSFTIDTSGESILLSDVCAMSLRASTNMQTEAYAITGAPHATVAAQSLSIPSTDVEDAMNEGTMSIWVHHFGDGYDEMSSTGVNTFVEMSGLELKMYIYRGGGSPYVTGSYDGATIFTQYTFVGDVPIADSLHHYVFTWKHGSPGSGAFYYDGAQVATDNVGNTTAPAAATLYIGAASAQQQPNGAVSRFRMWKTQLSQADAESIYTLEKGEYGL
jgi:hypothetical protein